MKTELINHILKSPSAQTVIKWMSPIYGEAYIMLWLIQTIGRQLDKEEDWIENFRSEIVPQTATWSIDVWEKQYGITPESWWTLEQRRQNIVNRAGAYLPMNPEQLEQLASTEANASVSITENTGKNKFNVLLSGSANLRGSVIKVIDSYKPAHLIYDLYIQNLIDGSSTTYFVPTAARKKSYTIRSWGQASYAVQDTFCFSPNAAKRKLYSIDCWGKESYRAEASVYIYAGVYKHKHYGMEV